MLLTTIFLQIRNDKRKFRKLLSIAETIHLKNLDKL